MTKKQFKQACAINEQINSAKALLNQVEKKHKSSYDDDFRLICQIAYDALDWKIQALEEAFKTIKTT